MTKRSTCTNLVSFVNNICEKVDKNLQVDAIYTDFSKAFDKVSHTILVAKLSAYGITGYLLEWCKSYLKSRQSSVVLNGITTKPFTASSGVPQGSNLGPLFFKIFINDICDIIQYSDFYIFADDLKLCRTIYTNNDSLLLQQDIDNITKWCVTNKMTLKTDKCSHIKFTRKRNRKQTCYKIGTQTLNEVDHIRDLGIIIDSQLRFIHHVNKMLNSAYQSLGFVLRCSREFKRVETILQLYYCYVRSKLEYCCPVCSSVYKVHCDRIENIQKTLIRHLEFRTGVRKSKTNRERLQQFKLHSLHDRRSLLQMSFLHKLFNNNIDCNALIDELNINVPPVIPRYQRPFFTIKCYKSNLGKNSPLARLQRKYNELTKLICDLDIAHDTHITFKNKISKFMMQPGT